ncbi:lipocalin family protein [Kiritimatiellaeota bacterium B1221]|nr:lipocalin family protein [Kiritimatiellaeota bacterium B1221]
MKVILLVILFLTSACSTMKPIQTESHVDLDRFMGDWYVVANIPTFLEKEAWNALENYQQGEGNRIETTFTFNKGAADGEFKTYTPVGFVDESDPSNAVWGMRFVWPVKAEYIIMYVDNAYEVTIVGRRKRDYVWIMARDPNLPEARIQALIDMAVAEGYDPEQIQRVPHASH